MPNTSKENYKLSGLSHLTAVSGANIAIIFMAGYRFGILVRVPRPPYDRNGYYRRRSLLHDSHL